MQYLEEIHFGHNYCNENKKFNDILSISLKILKIKLYKKMQKIDNMIMPLINLEILQLGPNYRHDIGECLKHMNKLKTLIISENYKYAHTLPQQKINVITIKYKNK